MMKPLPKDSVNESLIDRELFLVSCRGAGYQGNADRDTRTDQPTSAGALLSSFESTGI